LASIDAVERQTSLLGIILRDQLSVRETEAIIKQSKKKAPGKSSSEVSAKDPNVKKVEQRLSEYLGSPVLINYSKKGKGKISIVFNSDGELNDIIDAIED